MPEQYSINNLPARIRERIYFQPDGCWVWRGSLNHRGKALIWFNGKGEVVSRLMYKLFVEPDLSPSLVGKRTCETDDCVSPYHHQFNPKLIAMSDTSKAPSAILEKLPSLANRIVDIHGCWVWVGKLERSGYGRIFIDGKNVLAHRFVYGEFKEPVPDDMCLCHHCDNPPCTNPEHMFVGTRTDNNNDMVAKGRTTHGERAYHGKLTAIQAVEIRKKRENGATVCDLSKEYGIATQNIYLLLQRKTWARV